MLVSPAAFTAGVWEPESAASHGEQRMRVRFVNSLRVDQRAVGNTTGPLFFISGLLSLANCEVSSDGWVLSPVDSGFCSTQQFETISLLN